MVCSNPATQPGPEPAGPDRASDKLLAGTYGDMFRERPVGQAEDSKKGCRLKIVEGSQAKDAAMTFPALNSNKEAKRNMTSTVGFKVMAGPGTRPPRRRAPQSAGVHTQLQQNAVVDRDFIQLDNLQMVKSSEQFSEYFPDQDKSNVYFLTKGPGQEWARTSASGKMEGQNSSK